MGTNKRAAGEASQAQPLAKKAASSAAAPAAASGAPAPAAASSASPLAPVAPLCITQLLETENASRQQGQLTEWVRQVKNYVDHGLHGFLDQRKLELSFALPRKCSMIPPLAITQAASGANLTAFREVMDYDHLVASFSRTKQYEAAGTVWMLDPICSDVDDVSVSQLEGAMGMWSEETYRLSSSHAPSRRLSFDVPLPVKVVDEKVAQRAVPGKPGVRVTEAMPMLAGRAVVITWYSAMSVALQQRNEDRVWCLFNAALSVPIRMRMLPDGDATRLAALSFSEALFASCAASGADNC